MDNCRFLPVNFFSNVWKVKICKIFFMLSDVSYIFTLKRYYRAIFRSPPDLRTRPEYIEIVILFVDFARPRFISTKAQHISLSARARACGFTYLTSFFLFRSPRSVKRKPTTGAVSCSPRGKYTRMFVLETISEHWFDCRLLSFS